MNLKKQAKKALKNDAHIHAGYVLFYRKSKETGKPEFLRLLRSELKSPDQEKWVLPGGKADLGEDFFQATKREVQEETGYDRLKKKHLKPVYLHEKKADRLTGKTRLNMIFLSYAGADFDPTQGFDFEREFQDHQWVPFEQLAQNAQGKLAKAVKHEGEAIQKIAAQTLEKLRLKMAA